MNLARNARSLAAAAAVTALTTAALAGCAGGGTGTGTTTASSSAPAAAAPQVTISYGLWDPNQEAAMKQIAAAFESANPNIHVDVQVTPGQQFFTKLQTSMAAGNAPDVFWMSPVIFQMYASNGALKSLDDLGLDTSSYPSQLVKGCQAGGKLYGVPKDFDTIGVWYNKSLFDAAGVAYPAADWTWSDFQTAAAKLTDKSKGVYGTAAELNGQDTYYDTIFQAGGEVLTADNKSGFGEPQTIAGLKFWTDLIANGSSPSLQQMNDTTPLDMFQTGKVAMLWSGSWNVKALAASPVADHIDVAPLPRGEKAATVINGLCNVEAASTKHPAEVKAFLQFLGSKQANEIEGKTGTVIPAFNGTQSDWVAAYPNYHVQAYIDQVPVGVPMPVSKNSYAWMQTEGTTLAGAWTGQMPVAAAAAAVEKSTNDALAKEQG